MMEEDDSSVEVVLTISEVGPSTYGTYSLMATNSMGQSGIYYQLGT